MIYAEHSQNGIAKQRKVKDKGRQVLGSTKEPRW